MFMSSMWKSPFMATDTVTATMARTGIAAFLFVVLSLIVSVGYFRLFFHGLRRKRNQGQSEKKKIAFFHPFCSSGGGGERVLWKAIQALDELHKEGISFEIVVYTVDEANQNYNQDLFQHVKSRFTIEPPSSLKITFVHLKEYSHYLEKASRFSLIAESWGTMKFAYRALVANTPDVFIDTTGCAFTFFVARILAGCDLAAYVHYPTISTDMLQLVWDRRPTYNNNQNVAGSSTTTYIKLVYYTLFAIAYACVGSMCKLVMVNSSWTYNHISFLWRGAYGRIHTVFPPCDVVSLKDLSLDRHLPIIVSIGQFRPEKDHILQIKSFAKLLSKNQKWKDARLILIGSCRGADDEERVLQLKQFVQSLELTESVEFVLNQPYSVVKEWFARASIGLHTMWNEHFGIGVVEMMAAGLIVIAHNSGGPKEDIVVSVGSQRTGFLAVSEDEFACAMDEALGMDDVQGKNTRLLARNSTSRFSDETFNLSFKKAILESGILR